MCASIAYLECGREKWIVKQVVVPGVLQKLRVQNRVLLLNIDADRFRTFLEYSIFWQKVCTGSESHLCDKQRNSITHCFSQQPFKLYPTHPSYPRTSASFVAHQSFSEDQSEAWIISPLVIDPLVIHIVIPSTTLTWTVGLANHETAECTERTNELL